MTDYNIREESIPELTKEDVNKILNGDEPIASCIRNSLEDIHAILYDSTQSSKIDELDIELIQKDADLICRRCAFILKVRSG